jgi:hypothetical protein
MIITKVRCCLIGILFCLSAVAAPAVAALLPPQPMIGTLAQHPCSDDLARLCKTAPAGAGRKFGCLDAQKPKLRPACKTLIEALDARYVQMAAHRHESVAKFLTDAYGRYNTGVRVRPGKPPPAKSTQP